MNASLKTAESRRLDVVMAALALLGVVLAYGVGYLLVDVLGWIAVSARQAEPAHLDGVRVFVGAGMMAVAGIGMSLWGNR